MIRDNRWATLVLPAMILASVGALLWQPPFAFSSPDVSYHAARILRASEGDYFTDPFSGTHTIYPGLFHAFWGLVQRFSGLDALTVVRMASALNVIGAFMGFNLLARQVFQSSNLASLGTLALGLVLLAPSGRYLLLANAVNFSLGPLFMGFALLYRSLESNRLLIWTGGLALTSLAVNISWYMGLAAVGVLAAVSSRRWLEGRLNSRLIGWSVLAIALPSLWTVMHLYAIRDVLPSYFDHHERLVSWTLDRAVLRDWVVTYATHWNLKFLPQTWRSMPATILWLGLIIPSTAFFLALPVVALAMRRNLPPEPRGGTWTLLTSAILIFLLSLVMTMTRDLGRVAWIQFVSFAFLLLFGLHVLTRVCNPRRASLFFACLGFSGAACLAYTVLHRVSGPNVYAVSDSTRAVIELIAAQPEHRGVRIFATEKNLRRLSPFVTCLSLVNHLSGRYYSQDPISSEEMLRAYESILAHDDRSRGWIERYDVRLLAFRHGEAPMEREIAALYERDADVILRNSEWIVLRPRGPAGGVAPDRPSSATP